MGKYIREVTQAALRLASRLLAEDVDSAEGWPPGTVANASALLHGFDAVEVVVSPAVDQRLEELARGEGAIWLELAENGTLPRDYIAHVLFHFQVGGYPGLAWQMYLLQAVAAAPEEERAALAGACPEYVGLWRAVTEASGMERLLAVLDRR